MRFYSFFIHQTYQPEIGFMNKFAVFYDQHAVDTIESLIISDLLGYLYDFFCVNSNLT